ncbi:aminotransferase class V-fold PLP-dependent enzyme [Corallococcus sp. Z5C101001]|uniref:aminotransferase class V-fold PLP-dependent enzyme n=1 Tax=Corallococcus sp. Z5C101001 TaxID=2596829 RepID=UPI00117EDAB7|nr:aminotransferase class V-fold PLP-dependent enzyme [Corallococcus sp. Z5C101001]TSC34377.1 aminotransferase class V-fold PLP-dependent enzyme [Corallococcus sp. Z5C101001]
MEAPACREDFPALTRRIDGQRITYLDNAATTLKPRAVIEAITRFYTENGSNIHRGKHYLSEEASDQYEGVRSKVAQFLGAYGNEVVFVKNTTEALNLVAGGLGLSRDDVVVGSLDSHHAQLLPWRRVANLKLVQVDREGRVDLEHYQELLRSRPKVVALTHCSNVTGAMAPIEAMAAAAKEACGAVVVVDAAQSLPHVRLDVSRSAVDFVAFSGHKLLGPTGVGCLFGRREALEGLRPLMVGGGMVDWVDTQGSRERKIPHRFEAGTPAIASVLGLGAALGYLEQLGEQRQRSHERALTEALLRCALSRDYVELLGPRTAEERCAIATFRIRGCEDLSDVARSLSDSYGIMCRSGHLCAQPMVDAAASGEVLRASAYVYNTPEELERLFQALDELVVFLAR